eukprot:298676-Pleurochrysis_carterae.AAC.1
MLFLISFRSDTNTLAHAAHARSADARALGRVGRVCYPKPARPSPAARLSSTLPQGGGPDVCTGVQQRGVPRNEVMLDSYPLGYVQIRLSGYS